MPKFVIEREIPGAGNMSPRELQAVSQTSCGVLQQMGHETLGFKGHQGSPFPVAHPRRFRLFGF